MNKRVVIYTRVSTTNQEDNFAQFAGGRVPHVCGTHGWTIVAVERDVASGANRNRAGLDRAIGMIERSEADVARARA